MNADVFLTTLCAAEDYAMRVHPVRCLQMRNRNSGCMRCAEACPAGCLSVQDEEIAVDAAKCIGCGTCATACPTCAIEARHPHDGALLRTCREVAEVTQGKVVIACSRAVSHVGTSLDGEKFIEVPCLGRIDESLLLSLAADGVDEVALVARGCNTCVNGTGGALASRVVDSVTQLLHAWNHHMSVSIGNEIPTCALRGAARFHDQSKRALLATSARDAVEILAAGLRGTNTFADKETSCIQAIPVLSDGTLPHFVPDRTERMLDALDSFGSPEDVMVNVRTWGHVIIDPEKCISCRMCAVFCPTGALRKHDGSDWMGITHHPADCVKCKCCERICPAGALSISEEVFAVDLMDGAFERYEMKEPKNPSGTPHSIWHTMHDLIGIEQVYER